MLFDSEQDALNWYESQKRVLTPHFLETIPWKDVSKHPIDSAFIPTLMYMRDVERFTSLYQEELMRTPTGNDPTIKRFMDRWGTEELTHADLINRFLGEAGVPTSENWYDQVKARIPRSYRLNSRIIPRFTNLFGRHFSAVHMTWGAINELSTLTGYQRLWTLAKHPTLEYILRAIAREEASHAFFYWSIARIKLQTSRFRQSLARWIVERFWSPVGEGAKQKKETDHVITTLFGSTGGLDLMHERVTRRIQQLPGFQACETVTERVAKITGWKPNRPSST